MKRFLITLIIGVMFMFGTAGAAKAVTQHDHVTYEIFTGETLTLQWDAVENATMYEVQLLRHDWDNEVVQTWTEITGTEQAFTPPKTGMYVLRCKAGNGIEWSTWSYSTSVECAVVAGQPRSWWVYSYTAPPGPIVIDNQVGP